MILIDKAIFCLIWIFVFVIPCDMTLTSFSPLLTRFSYWGPVLLALLCFFSAIIKKKEDAGEKSNFPKAFLLFFILFVFWIFLSYFWSQDQKSTFSIIGYYIRQNILIVFCLMFFIKKEWQISSLMKAYIIGGLVSIAGIFIAFFSGMTYKNIFANRYSAIGFDPNDLGLILCFGIPMAWRIVTENKKKVLNILYFLYIPLCIAAVFLTGSRGAIVSALIAILIIPLINFKQSFWLKLLLVLTLAATIYSLIYFLPSELFERFCGIPKELESGSLAQRAYIWQAGLNVFREHSLFGVGAGAFSSEVNKFFGGMVVTHNTFLSVLTEEGIVGFIFFISMLISLIIRVRALPASQKNIWLAIIFVWIVGVSFLTWDYYRETWFLFALAVAQISSSRGSK